MNMSGKSDNQEEKKFNMDDILSRDERHHMLFELHRYLAWVGEPLPETITIEGQEIKLHDLIWKLIQKGTLTQPERGCVKWLIGRLEQREKKDEETLETGILTRGEAEYLHDEAAGLLRAIMDLRDLEDGSIKQADFKKLNITDRVEDARRWVKYMKKIRE